MGAVVTEFQFTFELILEDLKTHPERAHRSVILISMGTESPSTLKDSKEDEADQEIFEIPIKRLLDLGVPIICAAGNYADNPNRQNIDSQPALYQAEDTPIINVGAADFTGERYAKSQTGNQLTLYAPGVGIEYGEFDIGKKLLTGTSLGKYMITVLFSIDRH
jgi:major intracellular serine protease